MQNTISAECFGEKIKVLRKRAKYTQEAFSELIGIEPQNLSRIERGLNFPSLATFMNISHILNIPPDDLLDVEHFCSEQELDKKIDDKLKDCTLEEKRLIYGVIKAFIG